MGEKIWRTAVNCSRLLHCMVSELPIACGQGLCTARRFAWSAADMSVVSCRWAWEFAMSGSCPCPRLQACCIVATAPAPLAIVVAGTTAPPVRMPTGRQGASLSACASSWQPPSSRPLPRYDGATRGGKSAPAIHARQQHHQLVKHASQCKASPLLQIRIPGCSVGPSEGL